MAVDDFKRDPVYFPIDTHVQYILERMGDVSGKQYDQQRLRITIEDSLDTHIHNLSLYTEKYLVKYLAKILILILAPNQPRPERPAFMYYRDRTSKYTVVHSHGNLSAGSTYSATKHL